MTEEIVKFEDLAPVISVEEVNAEIKGGDWLPRLQIIAPSSPLALEDKVKAGNFAIVRTKDDGDDVTNEVDCIILDARWKALDISDTEEIVNIFDKDSAEFKRIRDNSEIKDSGCMWGMEFLVYVESVKAYALYHCSSKTARRESKSIHRLIGHAATLKSELIVTKKYRWYGPKISACSTPFDTPAPEEMRAQVVKFREEANKKPEETIEEDSRER